MNALTQKQEITLLRSAVIGLVGKDLEGNYKPSFVKSTFAALGRKAGNMFVSQKQFLDDIAKASL